MSGAHPLRWRFPDPSEARARESVQRAIDAWWEAFAAKTSDLVALFKRKKEWDLAGWMNARLATISDGLFWEFGPGVKGDHRLVITCESNLHLRPLVDQVIASAPIVPGWDLFGYRLAEPLGDVEATVEARCGVPLSDFTATIEPHESGVMGITFHCGDPDDAHRYAAFVAAESILGEETLARWVGPIDVEDGTGQPLSQLKSTFDRLLNERLTGLADMPWYTRTNDCQWSILKLKPFGGGTGRRYSYVDLALTDVSAAIPIIVEAMRRGRLEKRAWILFFDNDLRWEWVGIWPDTPPPPLPPLGPLD